MTKQVESMKKDDPVYRTTDYSIFKKSLFNRKLGTSNLSHLIDSLSKKNLLHFYPIIVNPSMEVIDGQHRLEAAKFLGIEVFYRISDEASAEVMPLLQVQKKWGADDYIAYYISMGNKEYIQFQEYCNSRNISCSSLSSLGIYATGSLKTFADGTFKFFSAERKKNIDDILDYLEDVINHINKSFTNKKHFLSNGKAKKALISLYHRQGFNLETFKQNLSLKAELVQKRADEGGYYAMFRDIYNWQKRVNRIE